MRLLNPLTPAPPLLRQVAHAAILALTLFFAGCASERATTPTISESDARALIREALPSTVADKDGWTEDIYTSFTTQRLQPTRENVCAVVAVIAQESSFQVNPVVPGMSAIAWKEIRSRSEHASVPWMLVQAALELKSSTGLSYADRIDRARTEKDL